MKRLLTLLALIGFSAVSLVAVARVVRTELSSAGHFDRAAMEAWLTSTDAATHRFDLVEASPQVRRAARMLERDFHDDHDWRPYYKSLDGEGRARFQTNFMALIRMLFEQRADRYAVLPNHVRERYLDGQLNDFTHWYLLDPQGKKLQGVAMFAPAEGFAKSQLVESNRSASARERADFEFLRDLRAHFLEKAVGRFLPGKQEPRKRDD